MEGRVCFPSLSPSAHKSFFFSVRSVWSLQVGPTPHAPCHRVPGFVPRALQGWPWHGKVCVVLQEEMLLGECPRLMQTEPTLIKPTCHIKFSSQKSSLKLSFQSTALVCFVFWLKKLGEMRNRGLLTLFLKHLLKAKMIVVEWMKTIQEANPPDG